MKMTLGLSTFFANCSFSPIAPHDDNEIAVKAATEDFRDQYLPL
jgi:hypothetical protein